MFPHTRWPAALLGALLLTHLLVGGLGDFLLRARLPGVASGFRELELLLLLGFLLATLARGRSPDPPRPAARHLAALAFAGLLLGHFVLASGSGKPVALSALLITTTPLLAYALADWLLRLPGGAKALAVGLVALALLHPLPALAEALAGLRGMPEWFDARFDPDITRATGLFGNPIVLAGIAQLLLGPLTAGFFLARSWGHRSLLGVAVLLQVLVLFFSFTRAAWAGACLTLLVLALGERSREWRYLAPGALLCAVVLLHPAGLRRVTATAQTQHVSTSLRVEAWKQVARDIGAAPLLGHGLGTRVGVAPNNAGVPGAYYAHGYPQQLAVETGLLGLGIFAAFWLCYLLGTWPRNPGGTIPEPIRLGVLAGLVGFWVNGLVVSHWEYHPLAVLLGVALALGEPRPSPEPAVDPGTEADPGTDPDPGTEAETDPGTTPSPGLLASPAVLGLLACVAIQLDANRFQYQIERALEEARAGQLARSRERLRPLAATSRPWLQSDRATAQALLRKLGGEAQPREADGQ